MANSRGRKSDPRTITHDPKAVDFGIIEHFGPSVYHWCLCPGPCKQAMLRRSRDLSKWAPDSTPESPKPLWPFVGKKPCKSCCMLGKRNRTPKYKEGEEWEIQGYLYRKVNGKATSVARIIMAQKLGRELKYGDRVRF